MSRFTVILVLLACTGLKRTNGFGVSLSSSSGTFRQTARPPPNSFCPRYADSNVALSMSIPNPLDTLTSGLASIVRMPGGVTVSPEARMAAATTTTTTPPLLLKTLFDVENDRACRKVRERISELDLVVETVVPSAPNSRVFQSPGYEYSLPPGTIVPRLVVQDQISGQELVLSDQEFILGFFDESYPSTSTGADKTPEIVEEFIAVLRDVGNFAANLLRVGRGRKVSPAARLGPLPAKKLILYSYEGNQFCRLVREVLTELDLPYELRSAGKESPRRSELAQVSGGSTQCPFFLDPANNVAMAESSDIIAYLYANYADWTPPNEVLQWVSENVMTLAKPIFEKLTPLQAGSRGEDKSAYQIDVAQAKAQIATVTAENPVVIYTYSLSPFSSEAKDLLDRLNVQYREVSLGKEWIPGLLEDAPTRAALQEMTGQTSLPHIFVGGESIGGLFSGTPGLVPALEEGTFQGRVASARTKETRPPNFA